MNPSKSLVSCLAVVGLSVLYGGAHSTFGFGPATDEHAQRPRAREIGLDNERTKRLCKKIKRVQTQIVSVQAELDRLYGQLHATRDERECAPGRTHATACRTCHEEPGRTPAPAQSCDACHGEWEPLAERTQACYTCHEAVGHTPEPTQSCRACHEDTRHEQGLKTPCRDCHDDTEHIETQRMQCQMCHQEAEQTE